MALLPSKDEAERLTKQERRAEEMEKARKGVFIKTWISASPEEQAEILWELFSKTDHTHPPPFDLVRF